MSHADLNSWAQLGSAATAKAAPTLATDGVAIPAGVNQAMILVKNAAGTGAVTAKIRMWGYHAGAAAWFALGTGTGATTSNTAGVLNGGNSIECVVADTLRHSELVNGLMRYERLDYEILTTAGTGTESFSTYVDFVPTSKVPS